MKPFFLLAILATALASEVPTSAQHGGMTTSPLRDAPPTTLDPPRFILLEEDFNSGIPATWKNLQFAYTGDIWLPRLSGIINGTPDAFHEWFCDFAIFFRDNVLLSPPLDLSGLSKVNFVCGQHQLFPLSRLYNAVEVTTDGGQTFTPIYVENGTETGISQILADLSPFAGQTNVQIGFHYKGIVANEWSIDDVRVWAKPPQTSITQLVAGSTATSSVKGCGVGNRVYLAYSLSGPGPTATPVGNVQLSPPIRLLAIQAADENGEVDVDIAVPPGSAGITVYTQVLVDSPGYPFFDLVLTNPLAATIQAVHDAPRDRDLR